MSKLCCIQCYNWLQRTMSKSISLQLTRKIHVPSVSLRVKLITGYLFYSSHVKTGMTFRLNTPNFHLCILKYFFSASVVRKLTRYIGNIWPNINEKTICFALIQQVHCFREKELCLNENWLANSRLAEEFWTTPLNECNNIG